MSRISIMALAASVAFLGACEDDSTTGPNRFADVAGEFEATSFQFTSTADPNVRHDLVTTAPQPISMRLTDAGRFETRFPGAEGSVRELSGSFDLAADQMTFADHPFMDDTDVIERSFVFTRTDTGVMLEDPQAEFDFEGTGQLEPATFRAEFAAR